MMKAVSFEQQNSQKITKIYG